MPLGRMLSALAIGIHNLPEGIATYVGAISEGFSLVVGIGLHNIPEGIAVAAPIYFATGSRWRGGMDPVSEGILFAKDKTHTVAVGMFAGMFIMVASLTLFGYAGV